MIKPIIFIADRFTLRALTLLESSFTIRKAKEPSCNGDDLSDIEGLVIRSRTRVDRQFFLKCPKLKFIVTATSGFDHIDLSEATSRGVKVALTPEANAASAAELTWALVLACARQLIESHASVKSGDWNSKLNPGVQLCGKTYGVVGLGRIGKRVAKIARAFDMNVLGFDPYANDDAFVDVQRVAFEELLKMSDVVSLHVPLTRETKRLINRNTLEYIQREAILINTSRGEVIDEQDLIEALKNGWLRSVGLDVFLKEPLARDSNLLQSGRVVLSPHIGARTDDAFEQASLDAANQVIEFFTTGNVTHPLPPTALWYASPKGFN